MQLLTGARDLFITSVLREQKHIVSNSKRRFSMIFIVFAWGLMMFRRGGGIDVGHL